MYGKNKTPQNGQQEKAADWYMKWTTDETPHEITHLPVGSYLWKEIQVPSGFVSHDPVAVRVTDRPELQKFEMKEEHTRVEVEKYCLENGKDSADGEVPVAGAGFTLYPAKLDAAEKDDFIPERRDIPRPPGDGSCGAAGADRKRSRLRHGGLPVRADHGGRDTGGHPPGRPVAGWCEAAGTGRYGPVSGRVLHAPCAGAAPSGAGRAHDRV